AAYSRVPGAAHESIRREKNSCVPSPFGRGAGGEGRRSTQYSVLSTQHGPSPPAPLPQGARGEKATQVSLPADRGVARTGKQDEKNDSGAGEVRGAGLGGPGGAGAGGRPAAGETARETARENAAPGAAGARL